MMAFRWCGLCQRLHCPSWLCILSFWWASRSSWLLPFQPAHPFLPPKLSLTVSVATFPNIFETGRCVGAKYATLCSKHTSCQPWLHVVQAALLPQKPMLDCCGLVDLPFDLTSAVSHGMCFQLASRTSYACHTSCHFVCMPLNNFQKPEKEQKCSPRFLIARAG